MPKKIIITTLIVLITIMFPVNLKASLIPKEISQNYIIYEDDNFFIESHSPSLLFFYSITDFSFPCNHFKFLFGAQMS